MDGKISVADIDVSAGPGHSAVLEFKPYLRLAKPEEETDQSRSKQFKRKGLITARNPGYLNWNYHIKNYL